MSTSDFFLDAVADRIADHLREQHPNHSESVTAKHPQHMAGWRRAVQAVADAFQSIQGDEFDRWAWIETTTPNDET